HDCASKTPRLALAAQFPKNLRQLFGAGLIHQVRCSQRLALVEAHVQRTVLLKTEPAPSRLQLTGPQTQVEQQSVATAFRNPVRQLRKIALPNLETAGKLGQSLAGGRNRLAVAITSVKPSARRTGRQHRPRMAPSSNRSFGI